jgi:antitoxin (DNA-binding transcriptional repressor) of toxin-antitoxin stability system
MTRTVSIQDLQAHTADLLAGIAADEEIIVEQNGQPLARISPVFSALPPEQGERPLGLLRGKGWVAPDFDDELPEEFWCPPDDPLTSK